MTETEHKLIYVRKAELAKMLGVSPRTIDNWMATRMIPVIARSSRLHLIDVEALEGQYQVAAVHA